MSQSAITILCFTAILIGVFGTFVPGIPGLILCVAGVAAWAFFVDGGTAQWFYLAGAVVIAVLTWLFKYLAPTKKLKDSGVPWRNLFFGGVLAVIGFFAIPVVGILVGFVLGVYLGEVVRHKNPQLAWGPAFRTAWPSAWTAVKAVGFSMIIDIFGGILILLVFTAGVLLTTDFFTLGR